MTRLTVVLWLTAMGGVASASTVWVFGDSLSDTGALRAATGPFQIPPDPPYPGGRRSNGDVWVDYLDTDFKRARFVNAAMAGAITGSFDFQVAPGVVFPIDNLNHLSLFQLQAAAMQAPSLLPDVIGLQQQVARFGGTSNPNDIGVIWAGANDFFAALFAGVTRAPQDVANDIGTAAAVLYGKGIDTLVIGNLPDLGKVPLIPGALRTDFTLLTNGFNLLLEQVALQLMNTLPGFQVGIVDINSAFEDLLLNRAASLGITDTTTSCLTGFAVTPMAPICSDPNKLPNEYVFYDLVHPTTVVHREIANEFSRFLAAANVPAPGALWLMLVGVAWLGRHRRLG